jgi:hypothetical protein
MPDTSCCGPGCPCPTGKVCFEAPIVSQDRALATSQQFAKPILTVLYSLFSDKEVYSTKLAKLSAKDSLPPPLALGSPPQSKLRVWLL